MGRRRETLALSPWAEDLGCFLLYFSHADTRRPTQAPWGRG